MQECPLIDEDLKWVMRAFWRLCSSRHLGGFGSGGIPFEAVVLYADCNEIEDLERFDTLITAMDRKYLKYMNDQTKT